MDLQQFKCPCCGGAVEFDSSEQKLKCPYCDSVFDIESIKSMEENVNNTAAADNMDWDTEAGQQWEQNEADNMRVYVCRSCGGEIIGDANLGATSCPYCDNPVVMTNQFAGMLKPDLVIPFKLDKKAAKQGLEKHLKGKLLLPKVFKSQNHIDEVKGIYVPFWLFDADADGTVHYKGTKVRHWSDKNYDYTETSYYSILRGGSVAFENVPVDGSTKMPDDLMDSIEPFNLNDAVDFNTAYLAGYLADKYDVSAQDSIGRANTRIKTSTEDVFRATVDGYSSVTTEDSSISLQNGKAKYALLPVWLLNTTYQGEKYIFAMNGQTGKFVGNLPMNKKKYWGLHLLFTAGFTVITYLLGLLFFS